MAGGLMPNFITRDVVAAFCAAVRGYRIDELRKMLDMYGAGLLERLDESGNTPLITAIANHSTPDIVFLLLDRGASLETKNQYGFSAREIANLKSNTKMKAAIDGWQRRREDARIKAEALKEEARRRQEADKAVAAFMDAAVKKLSRKPPPALRKKPPLP